MNRNRDPRGRNRQRALLAAGLIFCLTPDVNAQSPTFKWWKTDLSVANVTSGGDAILFFASRSAGGFISRKECGLAFDTDQDQDGSVLFSQPDPTASDFLWTAVDFTTGAHSFEAGGAFKVSAEPLLSGVSAGAVTLQVQRPYVELLVVRPGIAAWHGLLSDGTESDVGVDSDNVVVADLGSLPGKWPAGEQQPGPLGSLAGGDVVIAIDPLRLELFTSTVEQPQ